VLLLDRQRARFFDLKADALEERPAMFHPLPRRGRGDGFAGYDAGHLERRAADEALHHFKALAERLKEEAEQGKWDKLIVGCQNVTWREFEPQLHRYVQQRLLGRFVSEVANAAREGVREQSTRVLHHALDEHRHKVLAEVLNQARSHKHGVTGLRRVLRALQLGELQTLVMTQDYSARASECTNCGYLDSHLVPFCAVCGNATRELEDVCEAMIPMAVRRDVELLYLQNDPELDRVGNIAALLRFRAEQAAGQRSAAAG
jgi:peptide subunit release factor 1 (eRF1)